jgi:hypothetical protein
MTGFFDIFDFDSSDFILIGAYMAAELFIGIFVGVTVKQLAKFKASRTSDVKIFSAKDYSSINFGENYPRGSLDLFKLPVEFVIVQYVNNEVVRETFFTFLGDSTKAEYLNGQCKGTSLSALSSPVYLTTIAIPAILWFISIQIPFLNKISSPLFASALIWMFITFSLPALFILLKFPRKGTSNAE